MDQPSNDPTARNPSAGTPPTNTWEAGQPQGAQPPAASYPASFEPPPSTTTRPGPVDESAWVRSVYLFGACATGGLMMIIGLLVSVTSLVSVISPDSGLRDGWDRGLVGVTEVANEGLSVFEDFTRTQQEDNFDSLCGDAEDDPFCDDLADQVDDGASAIPDELTDSIGLIRDEVHRQIRFAAIAKLVGGLGLAVVGLLLFRFHSKQVTVYRRS